ncbi:beta-mannosidase [Flammeovirga aprica]|uniref:Beta-mannosidase B n=1 Tax=Flammeovirga aprica JL-4 TaxID=694437 RepID=A0A7X9P2L1_9BACT|nr:glycoside hydrolase family 2 protein [Flammeovirga aprica]NME68023.1 glycoside hydrolase family 2 protein [Flammeovirga aprica JL-4]
MNKQTITLAENWQFKQVTEAEWMKAEVPGTVHTDLMLNGKIDDPYYRMNERSVQWVDKEDWVYKTSFKIDASTLKHQHIQLHFDGIDTYGSIYLNNQKVGRTDNMFREWDFDIKSYLVEGENTLKVVLESPIQEGLKALDKHGYALPAINDQSEIGELGDKQVSIFTRKAGYHYGWDWGPRLVTSGIWREVTLQMWDNNKIDNVLVQQNTNQDKAEVTLVTELDQSSNQPLRLVAKLDGKVVDQREVETSIKSVQQHFTINNPKLWWTANLGEPYLYQLEVELYNGQNLLDVHQERIGLRDIKIVQKPDEDGKGKSFYFEVNGRPVFVKGANYIPNDLFLPRVSDSTYHHMIQSTLDANMNMLRVWGGGIYENDIFYDLCDEKGILVWQDFMFACSMYPGDKAFLENVKQEAVDNVKRLRNHASIAIWCGNNEMEMAWAPGEEKMGWGWKQQYTVAQRAEIWGDYEKVFHEILPDVVKDYTDNQFYWRSSPTGGDGEVAHYEHRSGDMHYWGVWHGEHPFSDFRKYIGRFMSEYGFQSFPEFKSVKKYTIPEDYDIESEVMASHQRSGIGNLRIKKYMEDQYQVPADFEDFLYVGQLLQAESIYAAIQAHREKMPYCMGSLYWQLNDCWPVASWSSMDYYGEWKALQYFAKEVNKNTSLIVNHDEKNLSVKIASDVAVQSVSDLTVKLIDFKGNELFDFSKTVEEIKENNTTEVFTTTLREALKEKDKNGILVVTTLKNGGVLIDTDYHYFVMQKELKLPQPQLEYTFEEKGNDLLVTVSTDKLVKNLFIEVNQDNVDLTNNYFDLLPNQKMEVLISSRVNEKISKNNLEFKHLQQTMTELVK